MSKLSIDNLFAILESYSEAWPSSPTCLSFNCGPKKGIEGEHTKYELAFSKLSAVMMNGWISGIILDRFACESLKKA